MVIASKKNRIKIGEPNSRVLCFVLAGIADRKEESAVSEDCDMICECSMVLRKA
jgi:hypothetical protein